MIKLVDLMTEGRYDKLTGLIVDVVWKDIKESFNEWFEDPEENLHMFRHNVKTQLTFTLDVLIKRTMRKNSLKIDAYVEDDGSVLAIKLEIGVDVEPKHNNVINSKLHDAIRHEIEHLTQKPGPNRKRKKINPTSASDRDRISQYADVFGYFTLPDEIPAMVHGLYKKAKVDKEPLDDEMYDYLKYFVKSKDITRNEMKEIMKIWIKAAKKLVPKAQYSYKFIKKH